MTTTHAVQLGQAPFSIPPALAQGGLRLVTFLPFQNLSPRIGVVLDDGRVADIAQEAENLAKVPSRLTPRLPSKRKWMKIKILRH